MQGLRRRYRDLGLALLITAPMAAGQTGLDPDTEAALASWRAQYGANWQLVYNTTTAKGRMLFGGSAPVPFIPANEAQGFLLARGAIAAADGILGVDVETLSNDSSIVLPLGMVGGRDKVNVRFQQFAETSEGDSLIDDAWVNVLFDLQTGALLSIDSTALPGALSFTSTTPLPPTGPLDATDPMRRARRAGTALRRTEPELVVIKHETAAGIEPALAWRVEVGGLDAEGEEVSLVYFEDALAPGSILTVIDQIEHFAPQQQGQGATGQVKAYVTGNTNGWVPLSLTDPWPDLELVTLPHARVVHENGQVVHTDAQGHFTVNSPGNVTVYLDGLHARAVSHMQGIPNVSAAVNGPGTQILVNPTGDIPTTAAANAYYYIERMRSWTLANNPLDVRMDSSVTGGPYIALTNKPIVGSGQMASACQGRETIQGFEASAGSLGQCDNASFALLIWHEMGHVLDRRYGRTIGARGWGEGIADVFALYQMDDPLLSYPGSGPDRNALNSSTYCGDDNQDNDGGSNPSCNSPGATGNNYLEGQVLMGSLWRVRANLKSTLGAGLGADTAAALFSAWMNAFDQSHIHTLIKYQWMVLDDDNGDLSDLTPNFADLEAAFTAHQFPPFQLPIDTKTYR